MGKSNQNLLMQPTEIILYTKYNKAVRLIQANKHEPLIHKHNPKSPKYNHTVI